MTIIKKWSIFKYNMVIVGILLFLFIPNVACGQNQKEENLSDMDYFYRSYSMNYDSLLASYFFKKNTQYTSRKYRSVKNQNIDFDNIPDTVFYYRLQSLPTVIPMHFNSYVRAYIKMYVKKMSRSLDLMLSLSEFYFPLFEETLEKYNMPQELKYLSIIESALNPKAVSRAGATGLWQFMYQTGKAYNLKVNALIDERRDPIKSTDAAARYLRDLYNIYNDWTLAIAAYNCGPKNINKAIARSGGKINFWQIYSYLPRETRGYIPAYIAATYIMNFYSEHGLEPTKIEIPIETDTIHIHRDLFFAQITQFLDISTEQIQSLNPQYKESLIPGSTGKYSIRLPLEHIPTFIKLQDSIYSYGKDSLIQSIVQEIQITEQIIHTVKRNETWTKLAKRYGVSEKQLRKWNPKKRNTLKIGDRITIHRKNPLYQQLENTAPQLIKKNHSSSTDSLLTAKVSDSIQSSIAKKSQPKTSTKLKQDSPKIHVVKNGESLHKIAQKYNTTIKSIKQQNNLKSDIIKIGQKLTIYRN